MRPLRTARFECRTSSYKIRFRVFDWPPLVLAHRHVLLRGPHVSMSLMCSDVACADGSTESERRKCIGSEAPDPLALRLSESVA